MDYIAFQKLKWHSRRSILELDICFDSLWTTKQNIFFVLDVYLN